MTSYRPAVEPTKKWSEMSQSQQRAAKDQYGSRSNYMDRKQAATNLPGVMPPRENPGFTPMPEIAGRPGVMPPSFGRGDDIFRPGTGFPGGPPIKGGGNGHDVMPRPGRGSIPTRENDVIDNRGGGPKKARDKAVKLRETYKGAIKKKLKKNKKNKR